MNANLSHICGEVQDDSPNRTRKVQNSHKTGQPPTTKAPTVKPRSSLRTNGKSKQILAPDVTGSENNIQQHFLSPNQPQLREKKRHPESIVPQIYLKEMTSINEGLDMNRQMSGTDGTNPIHNDKITTTYHDPHQSTKPTQSKKFFSTRKVSAAAVREARDKFNEPEQWRDYGIFVKTRLGAESVAYESYLRLRWCASVPEQDRWFNDEIMNSVMAVFNQRDITAAQANPLHQRSYFFNTHLLPTFMREGYGGVQRWGRKSAYPKTVFDGRYLFFPINQGGQHWVLVVGDVPKKKLWYLNSFPGAGAGYYCSLIRHYLEAEYNKLHSGLDMGNTFDWAIDGENWENVPIQTDGYSCGPFVLYFMEAILEATPMMISNNVDIQVAYRQYVARLLLEHWRKRQLKDGNTEGMANNETLASGVMRPAEALYVENSGIAGVAGVAVVLAEHAQNTYVSMAKLAE
jgi:hypothetical protein